MKHFKFQKGFDSQYNEIIEDELKLSGSIPEWLSGTLIRTAPSQFEVGKRTMNHWFDGLAMLHKFSFGNQKVAYANKFLKSRAFQEARDNKRVAFSEFGTDPCRDIFNKVTSFFKEPQGTDNGCVNINLHGNSFTATTETPLHNVFDLNTLDTQGHFSYDDKVEGQITTVHPHYDKRGTLFSYLTNFGIKSKYNVYFQESDSHTRKIIASIPVDAPAYMHSLGMTERFIILTEFPLRANPLKFRFSNKTFAEKYTWRPEEGTRIHVINKNDGAITTVETEPFFAFHHANAFEKNGEIVFDLIAHQNVDIIRNFYIKHLRSQKPVDASGELWRFKINLAEKNVKRETLSSALMELPRINYKKINTQDYQYVYGSGTTIKGNFWDNITKLDVKMAKELIWHEKDCYPGEPVFVENPKAKAEDEGVLLSVVFNAKNQRSFLLILDAKNLSEVARAEVPQHIPFGFHGQYVNSDDPVETFITLHH